MVAYTQLLVYAYYCSSDMVLKIEVGNEILPNKKWHNFDQNKHF